MNPTIDPNLYPYQNLLANLQGGSIPAELASLIDPQTGSFKLGDAFVSPGAVRELDPYTGSRHVQYATPGGSAQNANIWNVGPTGPVWFGADGQPAAEQPTAPSWLPTMDMSWQPQIQSQMQMGQTPAALGSPWAGQSLGGGNVGHAPVDRSRDTGSPNDPGQSTIAQFIQLLRGLGVQP
jgi:hypothetical protein